jgi:hypothetical protein
MASPEIAQLTDALRLHARDRFSNYIVDIQSKWGDPAVYQMQVNEMAAREAHAMHSDSRAKNKLLEDAYATQTRKNRETHNKRMATRNEIAGNQDKRLQSRVLRRPVPSRTDAPAQP